MIQTAVVRNLESLARQPSKCRRLRARASELSWQEMVGMRDKLIYDYLGVDLNLVWDVVLESPAIRERIVALIEELDAEDEPGA